MNLATIRERWHLDGPWSKYRCAIFLNIFRRSFSQDLMGLIDRSFPNHPKWSVVPSVFTHPKFIEFQQVMIDLRCACRPRMRRAGGLMRRPRMRRALRLRWSMYVWVSLSRTFCCALARVGYLICEVLTHLCIISRRLLDHHIIRRTSSNGSSISSKKSRSGTSTRGHLGNAT
jgi:hypothetical protein